MGGINTQRTLIRCVRCIEVPKLAQAVAQQVMGIRIISMGLHMGLQQ